MGAAGSFAQPPADASPLDTVIFTLTTLDEHFTSNDATNDARPVRPFFLLPPLTQLQTLQDFEKGYSHPSDIVALNVDDRSTNPTPASHESTPPSFVASLTIPSSSLPLFCCFEFLSRPNGWRSSRVYQSTRSAEAARAGIRKRETDCALRLIQAG